MSLLSAAASQKQLALFCRSLGTSLESGIDVVRALQSASRRTSGSFRVILDDILDQVKSGTDVATAVESHGTYFPDLFSDMIQVGEQTGSLPEVLRALADHYENSVRLRKNFISQITPSLIQLVVAIIVVAGLITILGWIAASSGMNLDILGWGLVGVSGALKWLGFWAMGAVVLFVTYQILNRSLVGKKSMHRTMMRIPFVGRCMQDFAIARFSWAFHLTQNAGMAIDPSLDSSMRATSNGAFIASTDHVIRDVNQGESLTSALDATQLFPEDFIQTVDVAETAGTVPEALHRLSPQFEENAKRSLQSLTEALGWAIWTMVAGFIIFVIFRVVLWYVSLINDALQMT
ncbi:type II secretion system F family protein [Thalassoglobus sp. JC818]|uniref:type II secretion system F family protein n=1 Tax=Thalassoglobus sp. JC818 TaxID=3232136 RepID=UPI003459A957